MQPFADPSPYVRGDEPDPEAGVVENPVEFPRTPPVITPEGEEQEQAQ